MRLTIIAAALALGTLPLVAEATTDVLYDGSLGSTPDAQGWTYATFPLTSTRATQTFEGTSTIFDTTAVMRDMAGYFYRRLAPAAPLDRRAGFTLLFSLRIMEERHASPNRAGFSLIVLSSDLKGVELAFWKDEIWAQTDRPLFSKGESSGSFNTRSRPVSYALTIHGDTYTLSANGNPILGGALKDYSSFTMPPFDFVYRQPDFLFFGDNTRSAAARVAITSVKIETPNTALRPPRTTTEGPVP